MRTGLLVALLALLSAGCGVNKQYVADEIAASETRTGSQLQTVKDQTDANAAEVLRLQELARQLGEKADLAINKASGFENYQIIWSGEINFPFDSYEIDGVAGSILDEAGGKMEQVRGSLLEIVGYTDRTGSSGYNLLLGEKRANSAKRYLANKFGISLYRMFVNSFGKEKQISLPDERNAGAKNRRVTLALWGMIQ
ncbi:MAG: OmpA family protein [candidate division Zixibacteria bacterium]|nr:OmpA family protein [candidate division Zixibacteria bacterium]